MGKAQLKAVEWSEGWHVHLGNPAEAAEVRQLCKERNITIVALGSYYKLGENQDFAPVLELAQALGAPTIRIWAGKIPSREVKPASFASLAKEAETLAQQCSLEGIEIAFEFHKDTLTDSNESAAKLLSLAPSCKSLWQPIVALSLQERKAGLERITQRLAYLHVFFMNGPVKRPLQEGVEEWKGYLSNLAGDHYALLEFVMGDREDQFLEDAATLHQLVR
ncbi:sugar phosphate isomerase/epimerase family protein [Sphaerochaeta pleomorpha]|nr:TIM barrel protein [Sphaerochaeta pleomorpha]